MPSIHAAITAFLFALLAPRTLAAESALIGTLEGHTDHAVNAYFTPDGKQLLTIGEDHTVRRWDAASGAELVVHRFHDPVSGLFYKDGYKAAAFPEPHRLQIWNLATEKLFADIEDYNGKIRTFLLAPDGRTAALLSWQGEVSLWDLDKLDRIAVLNSDQKERAWSISLSPDGRHLFAGAGEKAHVIMRWELGTGKLLSSWTGHTNKVRDIAFTPDGAKALSASADHTLRLWDISSGKTLAVWKGHTSQIWAVDISPDGKRAISAGADYAVRLWEVETGRQLAAWWGHQAIVRDVTFSPDGTLAASASEDHTVKLWNVEGHARIAAYPIPEPPPPLPAGPGTPEERLGRMLFFDQRLSGDTHRDCAVCHAPELAFADGLELSLGAQNVLYFRNTPSLYNLDELKLLYWDGRFPADDLPSLIRDHISEAHFMNADGRLIVEKLRQAPGYIRAFQEVYGEEPSYTKVLAALTAFVRSIKSGASPYDRYLAGDGDALSPAARRGYELFLGDAGCAPCHSGPMLTDGKLHDRGVPENEEIYDSPMRLISLRRFFKLLGVEDYANLHRDVGFYAISKKQEDMGRFRTPSLREVARTAPYMHNGLLPSLDDAVAHQNPRLSPSERKDITAFLESLTSATTAYVSPPLPRYELRRRAADKRTAAAAAAAEEPKSAFPPLGPLPPPPVPADNPLTEEKIELGKFLYFDKRLSGNGYTSCDTCHEPPKGWADGSDLAQGYQGTLDWRHAQTLLNAAYYTKLEWDGGQPTLEQQANGAITSNISANGDPEMIEERLAATPEYVAMFKKAFGAKRPTYENALKAIASFVRAVPVSRNVPFDKGALSPAARRGRKLFEGKAGCIQCHNGPLVSAQGFHATGVPRNPGLDHLLLRQITVRFMHSSRGVPEDIYRNADSDPGLYLNTLRQEDIGKFRAPSLRELKYTAPYMHNGIFPTLEAVVDFYNKGGGETPNKTPLLKPLELNAGEKQDLIAFLLSLSGDEVLITPPLIPRFHPGHGDDDDEKEDPHAGRDDDHNAH
ncbi:MAG: cytochrome c peroxidase [Elusimicrobiota bacterium]